MSPHIWLYKDADPVDATHTNTIKVYVCSFMNRDLLCIWDETPSSFERNMPEGDDGERQTGLFDGNGNSDRWADPRRDGGGNRQTEREQKKKGRDKDKDTSHIFVGLFLSSPAAGGP